MAVGERIRFIRNLRGMTQKRLGISSGLPEKTADIRIAQYESGTRVPKAELTEKIAEALNVSSAALNVPNIESCVGVMNTLFALEDLYGLMPDELDGKPIIQLNQKNKSYLQLLSLLTAWQQANHRWKNGEITREEYDDWRYGYVPEDNI